MLSFSVKCSLCQYLHIPHRDCSLSNKTITNGQSYFYMISLCKYVSSIAIIVFHT